MALLGEAMSAVLVDDERSVVTVVPHSKQQPRSQQTYLYVWPRHSSMHCSRWTIVTLAS